MVNTLKYLCGLVHNARPGRMTIYWCVLYNNGLRGPNACESGEVLYPTTTHTTIATPVSVRNAFLATLLGGKYHCAKKVREMGTMWDDSDKSSISVAGAEATPHRSGLPMWEIPARRSRMLIHCIQPCNMLWAIYDVDPYDKLCYGGNVTLWSRFNLLLVCHCHHWDESHRHIIYCESCNIYIYEL